MKSSTVWHGHSTRPSLPVGTARKPKRICCMAGGAGLSCPQQRETERSRRETPCCTYRLSVVLIASFTNSAIPNDRFAICNSRLLSTNQIVNCDGRVRPIQGAPCFCFALNLLAHSFRLRFSNIPPGLRSGSNRHSPMDHCR